MDEIVALLNDFGVKYNEKKRKFEPADKLSTKKWEVNLECTVDRDIGRVLAKIVFNYFTYCALQDQCVNIVYNQEFDTIRKFINGSESIKLKDVIVSVDKDVILDIEKQKSTRLVANTIVFEIKNGQIVGRLTLLGRRIYEIVIGPLPNSLNPNNFGCGHTFDPFERAIVNLSLQPKDMLTKDDIRATFGLYKRVRV